MSERQAMFWRTSENRSVNCALCPRGCYILEGSAGFCGVRENKKGVLYSSSYGQVSSIAMDPIEKKPLFMFNPGKRVLSVGSFGCNFRCPFCQNYEISQRYSTRRLSAEVLEPEQITALAVRLPDNIGVAYTYNEPLVGYEFVYDCAERIHRAGLCNVLVTNGYINKGPFEALLPHIDAMNIDLKGLDIYRKIGGDARTVKETIALANGRCHLEITTLVIPGENQGEVESLAAWIASINPEIPLHLSRFFPRYQYSDKEPTQRETIQALFKTAKQYLKNVYTGNMA